MKWKKLGLVFQFTQQYDWWQSHAMAPSPIQLSADIVRVFVGGLDANGISRMAYVDLNAHDLTQVIGISEKPLIDLGEPGTFDENGVFPASVYRLDDKIYLYYTGFQLGHKVPYFMFGGLGISTDNGNTFTRASSAPILDRSDEGLATRSGATILKENGIVRMWYSAGTKWETVGGKMRPTYNVYHIETPDGINTGRQGHLCVTYNPAYEHGLGRPQINKVNDKYMLFYTRRTMDMRYHCGCSISDDGLTWTRIDDQLNLNHSESDFDSQMLYFPNLLELNGKYFLFYNGNDFGKEGFGIAELISW
ncbi:MAG: hypothetical protein LWX56_12860 [Ignavibacteria bacterium]|nr:hypothetical protein [Ignavibacteria bacterium]